MKKKIDNVGRIVIPIQIRKDLNLKNEDYLLIDYDSAKKQITLKKVFNTCASCGNKQDVFTITDGLHLCKKCLEQWNKQINA